MAVAVIVAVVVGTIEDCGDVNFSSNSGRGIFILQTTITILKFRIESTSFHSNVKDGLYSGYKNYIDLFDTSFSQNQ